MGAKGQAKTGGRKPGTPNKKTQDLLDKCEAVGVDPFTILLMLAKGDWEGLGYETPSIAKMSGEAIIETPIITLDHRLAAAKECAQYLYPKRKAIEHEHNVDKGLMDEAAQLAAMEESQLLGELDKELKLIKGKKA